MVDVTGDEKPARMLLESLTDTFQEGEMEFFGEVGSPQRAPRKGERQGDPAARGYHGQRSGDDGSGGGRLTQNADRPGARLRHVDARRLSGHAKSALASHQTHGTMEHSSSSNVKAPSTTEYKMAVTAVAARIQTELDTCPRLQASVTVDLRAGSTTT